MIKKGEMTNILIEKSFLTVLDLATIAGCIELVSFFY